MGERELKILVRIGTDILDKAIGLFELLKPGPQSLQGTTDPGRIQAFQRKVDEINLLRPYWSAMLSRSLLYRELSMVSHAILADQAGKDAREMFERMETVLVAGHGDFANALAGMTEKGAAISRNRAQEILSQARALAARSLATVRQSISDFEKLWRTDPILKEIPFGSMYLLFAYYHRLLEANAEACLLTKKAMRDSKAPDRACLQGMRLGTLGVEPPGAKARKEISDFAVKDLQLKRAEMVRTGVSPVAIIEFFKGRLSKLTDVVSRLLREPSLQDAGRAGTRMQLSYELNRSVAVLIEEGKTKEAESARKELRKAENDVPYESYTVEALERLKEGLEDAYRDIDYVATHPDGRPKKPGEMTKAEIEEVERRRVGAVDTFAKALTESFVLIEGETVRSIVGVGKFGRKQAKVYKVLVELFEAVDKSLLFAPYTEALIIRTMALDLGIEAPRLQAYFDVQLKRLDKAILEGREIKLSIETEEGETPSQKVEYIEGNEIREERREELKIERSRMSRLKDLVGTGTIPDSIRADYSKLLSWEQQDALARAETGKPLSATSEIFPQIAKQKEEAQLLGASADTLIAKIKGTKDFKPDPLYESVMKKFPELLQALEDATRGLKAGTEKIKKYESAQVAADIGERRIALETVRKDLELQLGLVSGLETAVRNVEDKLNKAGGWARTRAILFQAPKWVWSRVFGKDMMSLASKNALVGWIYGVLGLVFQFGVIWTIPQFIALMFGVRIGNPIVWISELIGKLVGMIPNPGIPERGAKPAPDEPTSPTTNLLLLGFAVSMIFFGKQFFPAVGQIFQALTAGIKSLTQVIPGVKPKKGRKKGIARDREPVVIGRGRPIDVDQAREDLVEARDAGDKSRERRAVEKLKRAEARGQAIPPGLIGFIFGR